MGFLKTDLAIALFVLVFSLGLLFLSLNLAPVSGTSEAAQEQPNESLRHRINQSYFDELTKHDVGESPEVLKPDPVDPNDPDSTPYATNLPASVLVAPFYTSNGSNTTAVNTRFSLTNTRTSTVYVRLFFIEGSTCTPATVDLFLTSRQTITLLASDFDPGTKGWLLAFEADSSTGDAKGDNSLVGNAVFKTASGHSGGYNMIGFRALNSTPGPSGILKFDDVNFEKWPDNLILPEFPSNLNGNSNRLVLITAPDVRQDFVPPGTFNYSATAFDDNETGASSTFSKSGCFSDTNFNSTFPVSGLDTLVPSGHTGWLKLNTTGPAGKPILGLYMNYNPTAGPDNFNGAHTLSGFCGSGTCPAVNVFYDTFE
jgi:hypothetical protein